MHSGSNRSPVQNSPANREINREFYGFRPFGPIFHAQSASRFSGLQQNSLRKGTGNFWRANRDFFGANREFNRRIEGSKDQRKLRTLNSHATTPQRYTRMRFPVCTGSDFGRMVEDRSLRNGVDAYQLRAAERLPLRRSVRALVAGIALRRRRSLGAHPLRTSFNRRLCTLSLRFDCFSSQAGAAFL